MVDFLKYFQIMVVSLIIRLAFNHDEGLVWMLFIKCDGLYFQIFHEFYADVNVMVILVGVIHFHSISISYNSQVDCFEVIWRKKNKWPVH